MLSQKVSLTVRSTIIKLEELTFDCPLSWTISMLKSFVAMNHKNGSNYLHPEKNILYLFGQPCDDRATLLDYLKNKNLKSNFIIMAKYQHNVKVPVPEPNKDINYKLYQHMTDEMDCLFTNHLKYEETKTNIDCLDTLAKLPINDSIAFSKFIKTMNEPNKKPPKDENPIEINRELLNMEFPEGEHDYIIKIVMKAVFFFFIFKSFIKGVFIYYFAGALLLYVLVKVQQKKLKRRLRENEANQRNENRNNANDAPRVQDNLQPAPDNNQIQNENNREVNNPNLRRGNNFLDHAYDMMTSFVGSLFPFWDVNLFANQNLRQQIQNNVPAPQVENGQAQQQPKNSEEISETDISEETHETITLSKKQPSDERESSDTSSEDSQDRDKKKLD